MDTIFTHSENSKTSDPHILLPNLLDKANLKRSDKYVALSNLSIYYTQKHVKKSCKNNECRILATGFEATITQFVSEHSTLRQTDNDIQLKYHL